MKFLLLRPRKARKFCFAVPGRTLLLALWMLVLPAHAAQAAPAPFSRGVNLTGWLQVDGPQQIHFSRFGWQDLVNIKSLGCDVIRLPINLHAMTSGAPNFTIDPLFFELLDQIVGWAEELQIHLILDNHTFDPAVSTDPAIGRTLILVWSQMARHYKNHSNYLYYEILNEPHGIDDAKWNEIQQLVIAAIRAYDSKHTIVVGPAGWNSYNNLQYMPVYKDKNLIYTFHFYDPFIFTHQGASWTDPSLVPLAGVPFPYDPARMPTCPPTLIGSWINGELASNYRSSGTVQRLQETLEIAARFAAQRNVPIFCGEFGVYIPNSDPVDRAYWYDVVQNYLEEKEIAWTIWDYTGGFGLFESGGNDLFNYDLNVPLVQALGLTAPVQQEWRSQPDSTGFDLYNDFILPGCFDASNSAGGTVDFYATTLPLEGHRSILWSGSSRYGSVALQFRPVRDLSLLAAAGYALDFWIKCDFADTRIDLRFIDSKSTTPGDHPWRMSFTLDHAAGKYDGQWHHLQIPLRSFRESGSWDDGWFNPVGKFDWHAIQRLEWAAEHHDLAGIQLWIDRVRIVDPQVTGVTTPAGAPPQRLALPGCYPNPCNPATTIRYELPDPGWAELAIFNSAGQRIRTLIAGMQRGGAHETRWDGSGDGGNPAAAGLYWCRLSAGGRSATVKLVLLR